MLSKLKSRKLWVAVGTVVSILAADLFGIEIAPEAIAGLAVIVATYLGGQSFIDKSVVTAQVANAGDIARAQVENYARNLEAELEKLVGAADSE